MSKYSVQTTKAVEDDLDNLKHLKEQAIKKLLVLEEDPKNKTSPLSGNLKGLHGYKFNLSGAGAYRAVLQIKGKSKICLLIIVGPRENLYQKAARRVEALKRQGFIEL